MIKSVLKVMTEIKSVLTAADEEYVTLSRDHRGSDRQSTFC